MPQHPQYNEDATKDIEELQNLIYTMVKFGIMHEDGANEIDSAMKKLYITEEMVKEYAEENFYDLEDIDSIRDEMLWDISVDECIPGEIEEQQKFAHILNVAISTMVHSNFYGCVYDAIKEEKENN